MRATRSAPSVGEIYSLLTMMQKTNLLKPLDDATKDFLANALLFVPLFWQNYLDAIGDATSKTNIKKGVAMMHQLLLPYLADVKP